MSISEITAAGRGVRGACCRKCQS